MLNILSVGLHWIVHSWATMSIGHWPMYQIQIDVAQTQIVATLTARLFNFSRLMISVPQFGDNENVFAFHDAFGDFLGNCLAHLTFVGIQISGIEMTIANVNGMLDGLRCFTIRLYINMNRLNCIFIFCY